MLVHEPDASNKSKIKRSRTACEHLTQEKLQAFVTYNDGTGEFIWRRSRARARAGDRAGFRHVEGYWQIHIDGKTYYAHRLAWLYVYGRWPECGLDHINGVRSDNRICNLREATPTQNCQNRKISIHNKSGVKGVHWDAYVKSWRAFIAVNGEVMALGTFDTKEQAEEAYQGAALLFFGEFARLS